MKVEERLTVTEFGVATCYADDVRGTDVYFRKKFTDVTAITVKPINEFPNRKFVVNYADSPCPTVFQVLWFDLVTGARVDQEFTWSAIGV